MLPHRYINLTREGWYYVVVLGFIIGGAILREVNLLVLLAGMMIGPLLFSWRWVALTLANLEIERRLPPRIAAGDPLVVEFAVTNRRRRLTSWAIVVSDTLVREEPAPVDPPAHAQAIVPHIRPGATSTAGYRCLITRRGRYRFGPLQLSTRFPLGLVNSTEQVNDRATLIVSPRIGRMTRKWETWVQAERTGLERTSARRGLNEGEYYGMREWRAGDSQRWIHWRTSARLNEIAVRQFEQEHDASVVLLLDLWIPPDPSDGALGNVEIVLSLAASAIVDLARRANRELAVVVHSQNPDVWTAPPGIAAAESLLERLAVVAPAERDRLADSVAAALQTVGPTTRLIVFSTRTVDIETLTAGAAWSSDPRSASVLSQLVWIDVTQEDLASLLVLD